VASPSRCEGFGLPVLEAMACGAPVLTTHRASLPEVGGDTFSRKPLVPARSAAYRFSSVSNVVSARVSTSCGTGSGPRRRTAIRIGP
ncbi:glycosyltransferase, partial [Microbispora bryophytorum]|uniref:glycosyltransferase n=1 Tax=Microbispora bryophytorum TaxID=1460882 RepID=UPI003F4CB4AF